MAQDEIIKMARQVGLVKRHDCQEWVCNTNDLKAFAKLVAQHERESCAKIADEYVGQDLEHNFSALVAHNIRTRGQA
jgi:hypothetical protein